jgi:hypothetical protein
MPLNKGKNHCLRGLPAKVSGYVRVFHRMRSFSIQKLAISIAPSIRNFNRSWLFLRTRKRWPNLDKEEKQSRTGIIQSLNNRLFDLQRDKRLFKQKQSSIFQIMVGGSYGIPRTRVDEIPEGNDPSRTANSPVHLSLGWSIT